MIAAYLKKSAIRLAEIVLETEAEPALEARANPLEFTEDNIPEEFVERLIAHYMRPFDGSYVKAFEFPVIPGADVDVLVVAAREAGYHVTRPEDGLSIFAMSIDEVEAFVCQGTPEQNEIPETDWN